MTTVEAIRKFAQDALLSQSACNLVALLGSWREHLIETRGEYGDSYDQYKDAPSVLFATQINHLCGGPLWDTKEYSGANDACNNIVSDEGK